MTSLVPLFLNGYMDLLHSCRQQRQLALYFYKIQQLTTESSVALVCLKNQCFCFFSVAIDLILLTLADKEKMHNIMNVFKLWPDWMQGNRVSCS